LVARHAGPAKIEGTPNGDAPSILAASFRYKAGRGIDHSAIVVSSAAPRVAFYQQKK
jgi:hypothetical protein